MFMEPMMKVLEGFHHIISRNIAGMMVQMGTSGEWEWASVEAALEIAGICLLREYVQRQQATIEEYVIDMPI